jgi:hypothetical protein
MLIEYGANSHLAKSEGDVFCITQSYLSKVQVRNNGAIRIRMSRSSKMI